MCEKKREENKIEMNKKINVSNYNNENKLY